MQKKRLHNSTSWTLFLHPFFFAMQKKEAVQKKRVQKKSKAVWSGAKKRRSKKGTKKRRDKKRANVFRKKITLALS